MAPNAETNYASYAKHETGYRWGDTIPGSRLCRCWCFRCGTLMRDTKTNLYDPVLAAVGQLVAQPHYCETCDPKHRGVGGGPGVGLNSRDTDEDAYAASLQSNDEYDCL